MSLLRKEFEAAVLETLDQITHFCLQLNPPRAFSWFARNAFVQDGWSGSGSTADVLFGYLEADSTSPSFTLGKRNSMSWKAMEEIPKHHFQIQEIKRLPQYALSLTREKLNEGLERAFQCQDRPGISVPLSHYQGVLKNYLKNKFPSKPGRRVAFKRLKKYTAKAAAEEVAFAVLSHAAFPDFTPGVLGFMEEDNRIVIGYEEIQGPTLEQLFQSARPDELPELRSAVAAQLALYCWSKRLIFVDHCDLYESNVLVSPDGRVKVIDFGLAQLSSGPLESASCKSKERGSDLLSLKDLFMVWALPWSSEVPTNLVGQKAEITELLYQCLQFIDQKQLFIYGLRLLPPFVQTELKDIHQFSAQNLWNLIVANAERHDGLDHKIFHAPLKDYETLFLALGFFPSPFAMALWGTAKQAGLVRYRFRLFAYAACLEGFSIWNGEELSSLDRLPPAELPLEQTITADLEALGISRDSDHVLAHLVEFFRVVEAEKGGHHVTTSPLLKPFASPLPPAVLPEAYGIKIIATFFGLQMSGRTLTKFDWPVGHVVTGGRLKLHPNQQLAHTIYQKFFEAGQVRQDDMPEAELPTTDQMLAPFLAGRHPRVASLDPQLLQLDDYRPLYVWLRYNGVPDDVMSDVISSFAPQRLWSDLLTNLRQECRQVPLRPREFKPAPEPRMVRMWN